MEDAAPVVGHHHGVARAVGHLLGQQAAVGHAAELPPGEKSQQEHGDQRRHTRKEKIGSVTTVADEDDIQPCNRKGSDGQKNGREKRPVPVRAAGGPARASSLSVIKPHPESWRV